MNVRSLLLALLFGAVLLPSAAAAQAIHGRVLDRSTRQPVPKAWVAARPLPGGGYLPGMRTGADGSFALAAPAGVLYRVEILLPDGSRVAADSVASATTEDEAVFLVPWEEAEQRRAYPESEVDRPVSLVHRVAPDYPPEVLRSAARGQVVIQIAVDSLGVPQLETLRTVESPDPRLTRAVVDAVLQWRFEPARRAGRPVRQLVQIPFLFR